MILISLIFNLLFNIYKSDYCGTVDFLVHQTIPKKKAVVKKKKSTSSNKKISNNSVSSKNLIPGEGEIIQIPPEEIKLNPQKVENTEYYEPPVDPDNVINEVNKTEDKSEPEIFTAPDQKFEIGKALHLIEGSDVSIFATGHLVWEAIIAAEILLEKGIHAEVINIHTIKPLDTQAIHASVVKTGCVVSAEEHQINGGLGDSIAQYLALNLPTPQEFVGVNDSFGESGKPADLMEKYGLNAQAIVDKAIKAIARKKA